MRLLAFAWAIAFCCAGAASQAQGQQTMVNLDPARTKVEFTLGATAHTVHGTFKLKSGQIRFDMQSGKASGEIIVDARSGDTDSSGRDKKMHEEVLESGKYAEIVFTPSRVQGAVAERGTSNVQVTGTLRLLGQEHEMTVAVTVQALARNQMDASAHFSVPYVEWGLKNPSSFFLRVDKSVGVEVHVSGEMISSGSSER